MYLFLCSRLCLLSFIDSIWKISLFHYIFIRIFRGMDSISLGSRHFAAKPAGRLLQAKAIYTVQDMGNVVSMCESPSGYLYSWPFLSNLDEKWKKVRQRMVNANISSKNMGYKMYSLLKIILCSVIKECNWAIKVMDSYAEKRIRF